MERRENNVRLMERRSRKVWGGFGMANGQSNISRLAFFELLLEARRMASIMSFESPLKGDLRVNINGGQVMLESSLCVHFCSRAKPIRVGDFSIASNRSRYRKNIHFVLVSTLSTPFYDFWFCLLIKSPLQQMVSTQHTRAFDNNRIYAKLFLIFIVRLSSV